MERSAVTRLTVWNILFILIILVFPQASLAFKVDTHVWIAQQVLNDLEDDTLEFKVDGQIVKVKVDNEVSSTLKNHPELFRIGSLGPDAFPDVGERGQVDCFTIQNA